MADLVEEAIDQKKHAIIEAGTGTGKSLAYLIPAVLAATADQTDSRRVSAGKFNRRVNRDQ
jgi:ATP-dependent DNA helicase DinG